MNYLGQNVWIKEHYVLFIFAVGFKITSSKTCQIWNEYSSTNRNKR